MKSLFLLVLFLTAGRVFSQDSATVSLALNLYGNRSLDNNTNTLGGGISVIVNFSKITSVETGIKYFQRGNTLHPLTEPYYDSFNTNESNNAGQYKFYSIPLHLRLQSRSIYLLSGPAIEFADNFKKESGRKTDVSFELGGGYFFRLQKHLKLVTGLYINRFLSNEEYSNTGIRVALQYK